MLVEQPDRTSRVWDLSTEKLKGDKRPASPVPGAIGDKG